MEKVLRKSVAPYYGVAATWVVYALLFDLYQVSHFVIVALLSVGVFLLLRAVCKDVEVEVPKAPEPEEKPTGNAELDKMIRDGKLAIAEMKRLDEAIEDETISAQIRRLEEVSAKIFEQVKAEPKKLPEIRRFLDYYLPTTLKILNAYAQMEEQGVEGANITAAKERIEGMMDKVVEGFEKQLDRLFENEAMDITTDVQVLEQMLEKDGLSQSQQWEGLTLNG